MAAGSPQGSPPARARRQPTMSRNAPAAGCHPPYLRWLLVLYVVELSLAFHFDCALTTNVKASWLHMPCWTVTRFRNWLHSKVVFIFLWLPMRRIFERIEVLPCSISQQKCSSLLIQTDKLVLYRRFMSLSGCHNENLFVPELDG